MKRRQMMVRKRLVAEYIQRNILSADRRAFSEDQGCSCTKGAHAMTICTSSSAERVRLDCESRSSSCDSASSACDGHCGDRETVSWS